MCIVRQIETAAFMISAYRLNANPLARTNHAFAVIQYSQNTPSFMIHMQGLHADQNRPSRLVEIFAYINTADWNEFLAIQEDIDLRILAIVEEVGSGFAVPSRLYHARDSGIDDEQRQAATRKMQELTASGALPFPEFPQEYRERIIDTLDYPPEGSPDAEPGRKPV